MSIRPFVAVYRSFVRSLALTLETSCRSRPKLTGRLLCPSLLLRSPPTELFYFLVVDFFSSKLFLWFFFHIWDVLFFHLFPVCLCHPLKHSEGGCLKVSCDANSGHLTVDTSDSWLIVLFIQFETFSFLYDMWLSLEIWTFLCCFMRVGILLKPSASAGFLQRHLAGD